MKVQDERLEEHAEGEDHQRRAEEEADGTDEDDQPSVEGAMPLAGPASHEKLRPRGGEFFAAAILSGPGGVKVYGGFFGVNEPGDKRRAKGDYELEEIASDI